MNKAINTTTRNNGPLIPTTTATNSLNIKDRIKRVKDINSQNEAIFKRLNNIKPTIDTSKIVKHTTHVYNDSKYN